jgi:NhaP-type Na+/H+ or K+/H+ antiporter
MIKVFESRDRMSLLMLAGNVNEHIFTDFAFLALLIVLGTLLARLSESLRIPSITGYFMSGIIVGFLLTFLDFEIIYTDLSLISNIALAFIAFELGTRLHHRKLFHSISEVIVIVLFQAIFTVGFVAGLFLLLGAPWEMALIVGVIAMATSPETIMYISRKYKTKGHLTDAIMPHIGVDDIVGVLLFAIVMAIATAVNSDATVSTLESILEPTYEILGSILLGGAIGAALALIIRTTQKKDPEFKLNYLTESVFAIVLCVAITMHQFEIGHVHFILSPILTPMFCGIIFTNLVPKKVRKENDEAIDAFTPPFIYAFFALIGMNLMIFINDAETSLWIFLAIAIAYGVIRVIGKQVGVIVGSKVKHAPASVVKYLVRCLLPQATVSIGMAQVVLHNESLPHEWRTTIYVTILIAAFIYQLIGPVISRRAMLASNEVSPEQLAYFVGYSEEKTDHSTDNKF